MHKLTILLSQDDNISAAYVNGELVMKRHGELDIEYPCDWYGLICRYGAFASIEELKLSKAATEKYINDRTKNPMPSKLSAFAKKDLLQAKSAAEKLVAVTTSFEDNGVYFGDKAVALERRPTENEAFRETCGTEVRVRFLEKEGWESHWFLESDFLSEVAFRRAYSPKEAKAIRKEIEERYGAQ